MDPIVYLLIMVGGAGVIFLGVKLTQGGNKKGYQPRPFAKRLAIFVNNEVVGALRQIDGEVRVPLWLRGAVVEASYSAVAGQRRQIIFVCAPEVELGLDTPSILENGFTTLLAENSGERFETVGNNTEFEHRELKPIEEAGGVQEQYNNITEALSGGVPIRAFTPRVDGVALFN